MVHEKSERSQAFDAFFTSNYPKVKAFARRLLMQEQDAEDIAQDIFLKIMDNPSVWQDPEQSGKYLFTMTRNAVFNVIKHRNVARKYEAAVIRENDVADDPVLHDRVQAQELEALLVRAVEQLPPQRRVIFKKSRVEGWSSARIAEHLGLSVRTVERHIYLALKDLKKILPGALRSPRR
jgi:RNA polymerase sigma-70 factor (ECF subfamily)